MIEEAIALVRMGFAIHPLLPSSKLPRLKGWLSKATRDEATVRQWWTRHPDDNIGCVPCLCDPPLVVVDIDARSGGRDTWDAFRLPASDIAVQSGSGQGGHLYYRALGDVGNVRLGPGVELRYMGNIVLPPSIHPEGGVYRWVKSGPPENAPELPVGLHLRAERSPISVRLAVGQEGAATAEEAMFEAQDTLALLTKLDPQWCNDRSLWVRVAMATKSKFEELGFPDLGFHIWDVWSRTSSKYNPIEARVQWDSLSGISLSGRVVTWGAIIVEAGLGRIDPRSTAREDRAIFWAKDALVEPPPIDWLVENLFSKGSVISFVGEPGSKKSYSAMDLAACMALGQPWLGFDTRPTPVLYVDEEHGLSRLHRRLHEVLVGHGATEETPLAFVTLWGFRLITPAALAELESVIMETKAGLVILDSFIDFLLGADENASADVQAIMWGIRSIAGRTGASFLVIHHLNKMGGYRGSSALPAACDLMLEVKSKEGSNEVEFISQKVRDIESVTFRAQATWEDGRFWMTSLGSPSVGGLVSENAHQDIDDQIAGFVLESPGSSQAEIVRMAGEMGLSKHRTIASLDRLAGASRVVFIWDSRTKKVFPIR